MYRRAQGERTSLRKSDGIYIMLTEILRHLLFNQSFRLSLPSFNRLLLPTSRKHHRVFEYTLGEATLLLEATVDLI